MAIEQGLYTLLTQDPGVSALVGNKVYWILAPKGAVLPYIVVGRVATGDTYTMDGATGLRDGLFQIDCYATTFYASRQIALAARVLLESYTGNLPDVNATPVTAVFTEKDFDFPYEEGGLGFVFRALLQFRIWHQDTAYALDQVAEDWGTF